MNSSVRSEVLLFYLIMCQGNPKPALLSLKCSTIYCNRAGALVAELLHPCSDGLVDSWCHGVIRNFMQRCHSSLKGLLSVSSLVQAHVLRTSWPKLHPCCWLSSPQLHTGCRDQMKRNLSTKREKD